MKVVLKVNEVDSQEAGFRCWMFNSLIKGTWFPAHGCHKKKKKAKKKAAHLKRGAMSRHWPFWSKQMREGIWLIPAASGWSGSPVSKMSPSALICSQLDELRPSELTWHLTIITLWNDPGPIARSLRKLLFLCVLPNPATFVLEIGGGKKRWDDSAGGCPHTDVCGCMYVYVYTLYINTDTLSCMRTGDC